MEILKSTHRRLNPLTNEWILVSPHRTQRPWQGKIEKTTEDKILEYDPSCYLCPGNKRAGGLVNPDYKDTFVFVNDFSALIPDIKENSLNMENLIIATSEKGLCKVICFSPKHNLALSKMKKNEIKKVVELWINEYISIGKIDFIGYVEIFENKGAVMGCSNPHPHCQIWANQNIPQIPYLETINQGAYYKKNNTCLLCDYVKLELDQKERIIIENENFLVVVPFWATWPFETMILPKKHYNSIDQLNDKEKEDLSDAIRILGIKYDNLFNTSFPYSMGIHQKPVDDNDYKNYWHFHFHYYPPLLRSANIKKFMVGYEMLAMPQRDILAEDSAKRLRESDNVHYTEKG